MYNKIHLPKFPGNALKNDALFYYGTTQKLPYIYAYLQERTEVIHGPSCKRGKEIFEEECQRDQVLIHKRRGGGGTVVLSPGMVILVVVGKRVKGRSIRDTFSYIHKAIINLINETFGISISEQGISDCAIGNKKILGSSLYLSQNPFLYYYQSSLMVDSDLKLISTYLKHPPREPDYRSGRDHSNFCTTFREQNFKISADNIVELFNKKLKEKIK